MKIPRLADLLAERIITLTLDADGTQRADDPPHGALLSGSFNPLHSGHLGMAAAARRLLAMAVAFELPVVNADKGVLAPADVATRAAQFAGQQTLVLSRAPLFVEKARLYPGRVFVIGYDTAVRLLAPRYYGGQAGMYAALDLIRSAGCRFLVAGRSLDGTFYPADALPVPAGYADLISSIPEAVFRNDSSSTAIRNSNPA